MLNGLRRLLGKNLAESASGLLFDRPHWNLQGKPFTAALLDRHVTEAYNAQKDLGAMTGKKPDLPFPDDLTKAVEGAINAVAGMVMLNAMSDQGVDLVHLPGDPWHKQQIAGGVFGQYVAMVMCHHVESEGVDVDKQVTIPKVITNLTMANSEEDIRSLLAPVLSQFQELLKAEGEGVKEWKNTLNTLVPGYVLQWKADNPKMAQLETRKLFSEMFGTMLGALN